MRLPFLLLTVAGAAFAQDAEIQRALMERDQRTVEFAARLNGMPPASLRSLENAFVRQQLQVQTEAVAPALRSYQRQAAARENEGYLLRLPPPVVRAEALEDLRKLIESEPCTPVPAPTDQVPGCR